MLFAQCLEVVAQARHVAVNLAANRDGMRYAQRFELTDCQLGDLHGVINELIVVRNLVTTVAVLLGAITLH